MASSFASLHFIKADDHCEKYVDLIKPYVKSGVFWGMNSLCDIELLTVKTNYGFALFCEEFGMESIDQIACKSFKDEENLTILTAGILDGDIISVSIVQNGEVVSNITLRSDDCPEDIYEDIVEQWYNCEHFEELFGLNQEALKQSVEEDVYDTLLNWSVLLKIPFAQPYYSVEEDFDDCDKKKFYIKKEQLIKNAKVIDLEEFTQKFMGFLNF